MKTFLFKFHNNTLGYNYTVSKYVRNVNKDCTFCVAADSGEETTETPLHLFFDCPYVEPVLKNIYNWLYSTIEQDHMSRQDFFVVPNTENNNNKKFLVIFNCLVKKYIWDCKLRYVIPNVNALKAYLVRELKVNFRLNRQYESTFEKSEFFANIMHELG
jgi:hypothetical protein